MAGGRIPTPTQEAELQRLGRGHLPTPQSHPANDTLGFSICSPTPHLEGPRGGRGGQQNLPNSRLTQKFQPPETPDISGVQ